jgi:protein ImuA
MAATERPAMSTAERPLIGRLREQLRTTEAALGLSGPARPLALGIPAIDGALGGGLSRGTLHEIAAAREADTAAATGFVLGLAAGYSLSYSHPHDRHVTAKPQSRSSLLCPLPLRERAAPIPQHILMGEGWRHETPLPFIVADPLRLPSPARGEGAITAAPTRGHNISGERAAVVWIADDLTLAEHGTPYGPGLDAAGLAPERLITIAAARSRDVLWAMEEALRCRAIGLVIGELRAREIDPVATRRLSLAAAAGNTLGLLLRPAPGEETSAAATRWIIAATPSLPSPHGVGPPRLAARLMRNRRGHLGTWIVEWNRTEQRYVLASANPQPLALAPLDRSHPAAVA